MSRVLFVTRLKVMEIIVFNSLSSFLVRYVSHRKLFRLDVRSSLVENVPVYVIML